MAIHLILGEAVGPLNSRQVELMLAARQDSDRLLTIIDDLLDLTRIEQGRLKLELRPSSSAGLATSAVERNSARAEDAGMTLVSSVDPALPQMRVDEERVRHVFDNLIGNALEHTPPGGSVEVNASSLEGKVRFRVGDTGEVIAPEHLTHVFEKFYRVPGGRTKSGAGLGLAIVRDIVEAHGGSMNVESEPGRGSIFSFTLPIQPEGEPSKSKEFST